MRWQNQTRQVGMKQVTFNRDINKIRFKKFHTPISVWKIWLITISKKELSGFNWLLGWHEPRVVHRTLFTVRLRALSDRQSIQDLTRHRHELRPLDTGQLEVDGVLVLGKDGNKISYFRKAQHMVRFYLQLWWESCLGIPLTDFWHGVGTNRATWVPWKFCFRSRTY